MSESSRYELAAYADPESAVPVFRLRVIPEFSPFDVNLAFLAQTGWNQSLDRLRFHARGPSAVAAGDPLAGVVTRFEPHLLIRRLDKDEDRFASVHAYVDGDIVVLSNDADFAHMLFRGIFLECPPSFHTVGEVKITEEWLADEETKALFAGMLAGAQGWDPSHNVPDSIQQSLDEARRALEIANYRSSVTMSRRTLEAVLKFGYQRLLKKPVNTKGHGLMLSDMIQEFRRKRPQLIPEHLLHIADSIRLLGNVPGAHAADIAGYHFSRSDAEFALYAASHFLDQYFSKIDTDVSRYYTLTIDLQQPPEAGEPSAK